MDRKQGNGAKIITTGLEKISTIENLVDRKIYFMGLLTREAEKRHVQPIVVGGSAVDFYTEGIYPSFEYLEKKSRDEGILKKLRELCKE